MARLSSQINVVMEISRIADNKKIASGETRLTPGGDEARVDTILLDPAATHVVPMGQLSSAGILLVTSSQPITVTVGGQNFSGVKTLLLEGAIASVTLNNTSATQTEISLYMLG